MSEKKHDESVTETNSDLYARIKQLELELVEARQKEKAAFDLTVQVHQLNEDLIAKNKTLAAQNGEQAAQYKELQDPDGRHNSAGLGWLGKAVHVIRKTGWPLRAQEIMQKLTAMDRSGLLQMRGDPDSFLSVVLAKGVKAGRLKIFKVAGTRGGYYALEEWVDKDGKLNDEMKKQLL